MAWTIFGAEVAVAAWAAQCTPNPGLVNFVTREWLPNLRQHGPFVPEYAGRLIARLPDTDIILLEFPGLEGHLMEVEVDELDQALTILHISTGLPEPPSRSS